MAPLIVQCFFLSVYWSNHNRMVTSQLIKRVLSLPKSAKPSMNATWKGFVKPYVTTQDTSPSKKAKHE